MTERLPLAADSYQARGSCCLCLCNVPRRPTVRVDHGRQDNRHVTFTVARDTGMIYSVKGSAHTHLPIYYYRALHDLWAPLDSWLSVAERK